MSDWSVRAVMSSVSCSVNKRSVVKKHNSPTSGVCVCVCVSVELVVLKWQWRLLQPVWLTAAADVFRHACYSVTHYKLHCSDSTASISSTRLSPPGFKLSCCQTAVTASTTRRSLCLLWILRGQNQSASRLNWHMSFISRSSLMKRFISDTMTCSVTPPKPEMFQLQFHAELTSSGNYMQLQHICKWLPRLLLIVIWDDGQLRVQAQTNRKCLHRDWGVKMKMRMWQKQEWFMWFI